MRLISGVVTIVYLLVGVVIAANNDYFTNLDGLRGIVSAVLAVVLWPLILLDVDLHIGKSQNGGKNAIVLLPMLRASLAWGTKGRRERWARGSTRT